MTARNRHRLPSLLTGIGCALVISALPAGAGEPGAPAIDKGRRHWAFQPLRPQEVPRTSGSVNARGPIDTFLLSRLEKKRLTFSPEAKPATLIRRAYLDLWGVPPAPDEVDAF